MRMRSKLISRIAAFNRERAIEPVRHQYAVMAEDPFAFYRATAHLFYEDLNPRTLPGAPAVWCCGDAHLENFGSFTGDNGLTYFDVNDFDEAALLPLSWELARFTTSVFIAGVAHQISKADRGGYIRGFLAAYAGALAEGRARWIERATARGAVRVLLRSLRRRRLAELIDERTERRGGRLRLTIRKNHTLSLSPEERRDALELLRTGRHDAGIAALEPVDAAFRIAGLASLGLTRFIVLARARTGTRAYGLIDIKESRRSLAAARSPFRQPRWPSQAVRIVTLQRRLQAASPAFLSTVRSGRTTYVVRALQPDEDRLDLRRIVRRRPIFRETLQTMAQVMAWGHIRSAGREGSAPVDKLVQFAHQPRRWTRTVERFALRYGAQVEDDADAFAKAWRKERVPLPPG